MTEHVVSRAYAQVRNGRSDGARYPGRRITRYRCSQEGRIMTVAEQAAEGTTQKAVHTRALIIGTGFSGLGHGHRAAEAGRGLPDPGEGRRGRRHLAGQHLSRVRVRRAVAPVLVLVRAEARLAHMCSRHQPEILGLPQGRHRQVRPAPLHPVRLACRPRALGRRRVPLARVHRRPGRSTSRSSSSRARARCTFRSLPDIDGLGRLPTGPLSTPRSGTTASTSPASGWR